MATLDTNYIHACPYGNGIMFTTPGCGCCSDRDIVEDKEKIVQELLLLSRSNFREAVHYRMMAEAYSLLDPDIAYQKVNSQEFTDAVNFLVSLFEAKVEINE